MDTFGLVKLSEIVDDVINELKINESEYLRILRFAERGVAKLSEFVFTSVKTTVLSVDANTNFASFPTDYVMFSRIGVMHNGRFITLSRNDMLEINIDPSCPRTDRTDDEVNNRWVHTYSTSGGRSQFGEYNVSMAENGIYFDSNASTRDIVLEYVSTGVNSSEETYVPEIARETLIAWCKWRYAMGENDINRINTQVYKQEYMEELHSLKATQMPSLQEMIDAFNSTKLRTK